MLRVPRRDDLFLGSQFFSARPGRRLRELHVRRFAPVSAVQCIRRGLRQPVRVRSASVRERVWRLRGHRVREHDQERRPDVRDNDMYREV